MIEIDVHGTNSRLKKFLYSEAIRYYLSVLVPRHKNVLIEVCIDKHLTHLADAFCTLLESKYFLIDLSYYLPIEDQLKTLAHESVHCKQYLKKELQYKKNVVYWKGEPYHNLNGKSIASNSENEYRNYLEFPWEKEAYGLENELYASFKKIYSNGIEKIISSERKNLIKFINM